MREQEDGGVICRNHPPSSADAGGAPTQPNATDPPPSPPYRRLLEIPRMPLETSWKRKPQVRFVPFRLADPLGTAGLVRFVSSSGATLIGEPVDAAIDVGIVTRNGGVFSIRTYSGKSVLSPGEATGEVVDAVKVLSPLAQEEVGTIRGIALNVSSECLFTSAW